MAASSNWSARLARRSASSRVSQKAGSASRTPVGAASCSTWKQALAGQPAHLQRLAGPQAEQRRQLHRRLGVDAAQLAPVEDPGQRHLQRLRAQPRHGLDVEQLGADPADVAAVAAIAVRRHRLVGQRVGHQLGQRIPLRRRPAELLRVVQRQALEALLLAGGAVQVEQHQPGLGMLGACAAGAGDALQRLFALREVGIGEGDHGLVELGVVHDLADLHRERVAEVDARRPRAAVPAPRRRTAAAAAPAAAGRRPSAPAPARPAGGSGNSGSGGSGGSDSASSSSTPSAGARPRAAAPRRPRRRSRAAQPAGLRPAWR